MRNFHSLTRKKQNIIREEYKNKYNKEYSYSIRLFILYTIFGVFSIVGLTVLLYYDLMLGSIIFCLSLIFLVIVLYFLSLSNRKFYRFLNKKGYTYK